MDITRFEQLARHPARTRAELEAMKANALEKGQVEFARLAEEVLRERFLASSRKKGTIKEDVSESDVAAMYSNALPARMDQRLILGQLLESIAYCEQLGCSAHAVTLLRPGAFRLNVGQVEAMTGCVLYDPSDPSFVTTVEVRLLVAGADCLGKLEGGNDAGKLLEARYRSIEEPHWSYVGNFTASSTEVPNSSRSIVAQHLAQLKDNHHQFLDLASHTSTGKLRRSTTFAIYHSASLVAYARQVQADDCP